MWGILTHFFKQFHTPSILMLLSMPPMKIIYKKKKKTQKAFVSIVMNDSVKVQKDFHISFHEISSSGFFSNLFSFFSHMREIFQRWKIEPNKTFLTTQYCSLHFRQHSNIAFILTLASLKYYMYNQKNKFL